MSNLKIVTSPTVACIGRTRFDREAMQPYLESIGAPGWNTDAPSDGDAIVEASGRICYRSFSNPRPGGNAAYIARILDEAHGSVTEHANYSLLITGISRTCSMELIRHRHLSFSQRSQRYCDETDIGFVVPPRLLDGKEELERWEAAMDRWHPYHGSLTHSDAVAHIQVAGDPPEPPAKGSPADAYDTWRHTVGHCLAAYLDVANTLESGGPAGGTKTDNRKAARQAARSVLPGCTATEMVVTGNARAWRNVIEQRGSRHADAEIRRLALEVLKVLTLASPDIFSDFVVRFHDDGSFEITSKHPKV